MKLFNPGNYLGEHQDPSFCELVGKTIAFFEDKGLTRIKEDDQARTWYQDFLDFIAREQVFARLLTPQPYGLVEGARWDMRRICEYNEVLGFYGLCYWYAWQVTILGLGPVWMSDNEPLKRRAAELLEAGGVFAFGLSEKRHGADLYATEMALVDLGGGEYRADGSKYYIGNGNCAALVSTFGREADSGDFVFFAVEPEHPAYECVKKIDTSGVRQAYVAEFSLQGYPLTDAGLISRGAKAWNDALSTVNIGKFELGCASVGICTHAFYEALAHAAGRHLYGRQVTDFPQVRTLFGEAYARLLAMRLFTWRAADYLRAASEDDRRYLLFNPVVKMKVTSQGERVIELLHEAIAARGFEQETYFEMAIRDIPMLPKLEGTEHVNMALIIKFVGNYFFNPVAYPEVGQRLESGDDAYLFRQRTGGLGKIRFPDYRLAYRNRAGVNIGIFREQVDGLRKLLATSPPTREQQADLDYMLAAGELFTLAVYAQLILENSVIYQLDQDLLERIFAFLVRDFSFGALRMVLDYDNGEAQREAYNRLIRKPELDREGFERIWRNQVLPLTRIQAGRP